MFDHAKRGQHGVDFAECGKMARGVASLRWLVGPVDNRQAFVEKLPKHDPLTKSGRNAETDALGQRATFRA